MADNLEYAFPKHGAAEIYGRLVEQLGAVAREYGLKLETDDAALKGRVHRKGMIDVHFAALEEKLSAKVDFGMLIPKSIREKVRSELEKRLGGLFTREPEAS